MYKLVNLSKYYNSNNKVHKALDNISLEIKENEFVMISGPSGSGKSTLLNVLSGIDSYQDGEMYFNNQQTSHFDDKDYEEFRYNNISFVFQEYNLIESYTCLENIEVALISKNISYTKEDILKILQKVNLEDKINVKAAKLSGGQKARLAIARSLAFNAPILVLDEPTGALDSSSSKEVVKILKELKGKKTIIVVTHQEDLFENIANHHIKILDGKIKEDKVIEETKESKKVENFETKKYKKDLKLSLLNIKNQPKKSILSFSLCFVLTLFIFVIISNLSYMGREDVKSFDYKTTYDRVRIFNKDGLSEDDINFFTKNSYKIINEDLLIDSDIYGDGLDNRNVYANGLLDLTHFDSKLAVGVLPATDYEVLIPYSKDIYNSWDYFKNKKIRINIQRDHGFYNVVVPMTVVGMSKDEFFYAKNISNINSIVENISYNKVLFGDMFSRTPTIFVNPSLKDKLIGHSSYKNPILKINDTKYEIEVVKDSNEYIEVDPLYFNKNYFDTKTRHISIYTDNVIEFTNKIDGKYQFYIPNVKFEEFNATRLIVTIVSIFMFVLIYLLVFLTNFITKQIYKYKNKDNAILNSLGYNATILKKSLSIELLINYSISILIMIILVILDYSFNIFKGFFTYNSIWTYLVLLLVIALTIYSSVKNIFNLFTNNSLYKNLRGGDLDA